VFIEYFLVKMYKLITQQNIYLILSPKMGKLVKAIILNVRQIYLKTVYLFHSLEP